jgi:hypothetical protein
MPSVEKLKKDTGSIFHNYFASIKKITTFVASFRKYETTQLIVNLIQKRICLRSKRLFTSHRLLNPDGKENRNNNHFSDRP